MKTRQVWSMQAVIEKNVSELKFSNYSGKGYTKQYRTVFYCMICKTIFCYESEQIILIIIYVPRGTDIIIIKIININY